MASASTLNRDRPVAVVTEIERGSTVDGPGVRTVVFLKGCPLRCLWCHNPETIRPYPQLMHDESLCLHCRRCAEVCPEEEISFRQGEFRCEHEKCTRCFLCVESCPAGALTRVGEELSVEGLLEMVRRELPFIKRGGITFSGGEPLLQPEWTAEAARACRELGLHTALDTSLYCDWGSLDIGLAHYSLVMADLKHPDSLRHQELTGVPNELILDNLYRLDHTGTPIWLRTPLIPGLNDDPETVEEMLGIASGLKHLERYEFLPYNPLTPEKYAKLGVDYPLAGHAFDYSNREELRSLISQSDLPVRLIR